MFIFTHQKISFGAVGGGSQTGACPLAHSPLMFAAAKQCISRRNDMLPLRRQFEAEAHLWCRPLANASETIPATFIAVSATFGCRSATLTCGFYFRHRVSYWCSIWIMNLSSKCSDAVLEAWEVNVSQVSKWTEYSSLRPASPLENSDAT